MERTAYPQLGDRAGAFLVDMALVMPLSVMVAMVTAPPDLALVKSWAMIAVPAAYFALFPLLGATPGKRLLGLRIADARNGARIRPSQVLVRFLVWIPSIACAGLGVVLLDWTPRRQALHDLASRTIVMRRTATVDDLAQPATPVGWIARLGHLFVAGLLTYLVAIPTLAYRDRERREAVEAALDHAATYRKQVEQAMREGKPLPAAGQLPRHVRAMDVRPDGTVVVEIADEIAGGGRVTYRPEKTPAGYFWTCSGEKIVPNYLPAACR